MLQHILTELKQFITVLSKPKVQNSDYLWPQMINSSIRILNKIPASRDVVFEYFSIVFDIAVSSNITYLNTNDPEGQKNIRTNNEAVQVIQDELEALVLKGSSEWSVFISNWCLELIGIISNKNWRKLDIAGCCNFWVEIQAMKCLLGLTATCFKKMGSADSENAVNNLMATFQKYSPTFDWAVSRLASCYPLQIIYQIFQNGLKKFSEEPNARFRSEVSILEHLSFAHENDLIRAISELMIYGFNPKVPIHYDIIPFLLELCTYYSDTILHFIANAFLDMYNQELLDNIAKNTKKWMQNRVFQEMLPALNNLCLKLQSEGTQIILILSKLTETLPWCRTYLEYTLLELEQIVLLKRSRPLLSNLSSEESKLMLWKSCESKNRVEQQTAVFLLLLVSSKYPHIYDQTISELFQRPYNNERDKIEILIRFVEGMNGIVEYPSISNGLEIVLDKILLMQQITSEHRTKASVNFFTNLCTLIELSKNEAVNHLNQRDIVNITRKSILKILDIFEHVIHHIEIAVLSNKDDILKKMYSAENLNPQKKTKLTKQIIMNNIPNKANDIEESFKIAEHIISLLYKINFMNGGAHISLSVLSRMSLISVKFLFLTLHVENPLLRSNLSEEAIKLLDYQCNSNKISRQACLRELVENGIFTYGYLFGNYEEPETDEISIRSTEMVLHQNRKQIGSNGYRSVLHAGVIGDGLKNRTKDSTGLKPNPEMQSIFLKGISTCCIDRNKPNSPDLFSNLSLLLVEFISTDSMYNGFPFPDEEFAKSTVERDILIRRALLLSPILWNILGLLAQNRPSLCFSSVILRAICATCLHYWKAKNVNKNSAIDLNDETLICTRKMLEIMATGQLLPPPLSNLHNIIHLFDSNEIYLILKECIWNYLKDHIPSPALFQCDKNGLNWRNASLHKVPVNYITILKNLMQKKIHIFRHSYFDMFIMSEIKK